MKYVFQFATVMIDSGKTMRGVAVFNSDLAAKELEKKLNDDHNTNKQCTVFSFVNSVKEK